MSRVIRLLKNSAAIENITVSVIETGEKSNEFIFTLPQKAGESRDTFSGAEAKITINYNNDSTEGRFDRY